MTRASLPAASADLDQELLSRIAGGSEEAIRELIRHYKPLLTAYARIAVSPPDERQTLVEDVLHDFATHIVRGGTPPDDLMSYLFAALRNRAARAARARLAARRFPRAELSVEGAAVAGLSEELLRSAGLIAPEAAGHPIERLASELDLGLSDEERMIAGWHASGVPHSQIGEWLGITRNAAKKRIQRLSRRLVLRACRAVARWAEEDRRSLGRSFPGIFDECARRLAESRNGGTMEDA